MYVFHCAYTRSGGLSGLPEQPKPVQVKWNIERTGQKYDFLSLDLVAVEIMSGKINSDELLLTAVAVVACANVMKEYNSLKPN